MSATCWLRAASAVEILSGNQIGEIMPLSLQNTRRDAARQDGNPP